MSANVRVKMDNTGRILLKRYLNKDGQAQERFTKEIAKESDNYVPFQTGRLKNMMIEIKVSSIKYNAPYAARQYYTNKGNSRQGTANGGLRGKHWDRRMWADKGNGIVRTIAEFVGGRAR